MEIYMDTMYPQGKILEAHLEGYVDFTEEEEEDFQALLKKEADEEELTDKEFERLKDYKEQIEKNSEIVVDDFEITDFGVFSWEDLIY